MEQPSVLVVLGTRPEAIKLASVSLALAADDRFRCSVVHTGQHPELAADVLEAFGIAPDTTLDLQRPDQDLPTLLGRAVIGIGAHLTASRPDLVVVQGDTTTAAAAAVAAAQLGIAVAHVEAGLRSGDRRAPFPEEDNRRLISVVADLHLAPTPGARRNLLREGVRPSSVVVTGNTGIDALHAVLATGPPSGDPIYAAATRHDGPIALVTTHRRESWGSAMAATASAVRWLADAEHDLLIVLPLHPNPAVQATLRGVLDDHERVLLCPPLRYTTTAHVLAASAVVLTDSGGIQEEAPGLGIPVLVLRDRTERPEGVTAGAARLVGTDPEAIVRTARAVLHDKAIRRTMARPRAIYGDGHAARRVVAAIAYHLGLTNTPAEDFEADTRPLPRHRWPVEV